MPKAFKIGERAPVWQRIEFQEATDNGLETFQFKARLRLLSASDLEKAGEDDVAVDQLLRDHVVDWDGVQDDQGQNVAFSEDALEQALDYLPVRQALFDALIQASSGAGERKNSRKSRGRS